MFGGFASLSALKGLNAGDNKRPSSSTNANAEKKPRVPKNLTFPHCKPPQPHNPFSSTNSDSPFHVLFQKIKRPNHISHDHLQALNVSVSYDLSLEQLIPAQYHPNETDENGEFSKRRVELELENRD